jgi:adenylate cyclase
MTIERSDVSATLIEKLALWLKQSALKGMDLEALFTGTCERLSAAGMPLLRANVGFSMLHPLYDALSFTWVRGTGVTVEGHRTARPGDENARFLQSPFFYLLDNNLDHIRRRLDVPAPSEFPVFDELRAMGATDYLAFMQPFNHETGRGMMGSWATYAQTGFTEDMIKTLLYVQSNLAVAAKMAVLDKLADNMLSTYLGANAGRRVLSGQTRRGDGDTIRAVLVMGDMRESTAIAENEGRQSYIDTLNEFFDAIATPFNRDGGEILSFIGDGFLAVYPCERHKTPSVVAARAAMAAVRDATARMVTMNERRVGLGQNEIRYGIGLHVGNVMFGNVGLKNRLTFSAFGSAVNEVQRLESLTKKYRKPVIASQMFTGYCGGDWEFQGAEALRGTRNKVSLFMPGPQNMNCSKAEIVAEETAAPGSDAEQVMLLYRNRGAALVPAANGAAVTLRQAAS